MTYENPASGLFFLAFVVLSVIAVASGKPWKQKLYNLLYILGGAALGIGLGLLFMVWGTSPGIAGDLAGAFCPIFGAAAAYICMRHNMKREAASQRPEPKASDLRNLF
jgi:hypothetical protein